MTQRLLLCTDLDRTLIPNGVQPESANARKLFKQLTARPEVTLAYVTGRHRKLTQQAITYYQLPVPEFVIADVGSTIYKINASDWHHWAEWETEISKDWGGKSHGELKTLFSDLKQLRLQEISKQNTHKLSYYVSLHTDREELMHEMHSRLKHERIKASLIWSIDEPAAVGLLDVLPANATKRHAIEFLMQQHDFTLENTVFAGDSGNDLPVLASPIKAVLVANADEEVRSAARHQALAQNLSQALYMAQGGFAGMNGNYSAGIIEGVAHYLPEVKTWLEDISS